MSGFAHALSQARGLHRSGQLGAARAAYEALLESAPQDGDVLGLLGVVALQEDRHGEAETLLRTALSCGGEAPIVLRNLNNLLALLQRSGDIDAARALAADAIPDWPEGLPPGPIERDTLLSLCTALLLLDQAAAAQGLLGQAFPAGPDGPEMAGLAGRIHLALGETDRAAALLEAAAGAKDAGPQTLIAQCFAQKHTGRTTEARATLERIARQWPVYSPAPLHAQRAVVLVLNPLPAAVPKPGVTLRDLHFEANFTTQMAASMQDEFHFLSVFADLPAHCPPPPLPRAQVVLNNCVNAERLNAPGRVDRVLEAAERAGAPVINHPRSVVGTTRQKTAALLAGIPNLKVPRIERYRIDIATPAEIAADIEQRFDYPLILRACDSHNSAKLQHVPNGGVVVLAETAAGLREHLGARVWPEFYAIEYVPLQRPDGQFRKIRAVLAEDEVIVAIPGFAASWLVAGGRGRKNGIAYYRAHPAVTAESRSIVLDPEAWLGRDCLRTLEAVRDRLPLNFCGIDFEVDDAGQVVFFEANAAMNLLKRRSEPADITLPDEPFERIKAAFRRAVDRRIAGAA